MPLEVVDVGGLPFVSFEAEMGAEQAVRTAQIELANPSAPIPVAVDDEIVIKANGDTVLTGYVRDVLPSHKAAAREIHITFVSRTVDASECSVVHKEGELLEKTLPQIAEAYDTLGIGVETDGSTWPVEPVHRLRQGETLVETLEKRARSRGTIICDTPEGKIKLATKPEGRHAGQIDLSSIEQGSAKFTGLGRHSPVTVKGQSSQGVTAGEMRVQANFEDGSVKRRRPLIKVHAGAATTDRLSTRAAWEAKRAAGNAATADITVMGWRDVNGQLWTPNWLVMVVDPYLSIDGTMVIKKVRLVQDEDQGTVAHLSLADPRALGGENPRGKSDAGYAAPGLSSATLDVT